MKTKEKSTSTFRTKEKEIIAVDFIEIDMIRRWLRDEIKLIRKEYGYRFVRGMSPKRAYELCYFYIGRYTTNVKFIGINLPIYSMQKLKNRMASALPFNVKIYFKPFTRDMIFYLHGDRRR